MINPRITLLFLRTSCAWGQVENR